MSVIATEQYTRSNFVAHEYAPEMAYCREVVVVNDTAGTLLQGTIVGKVTSGGKYKRAVETASDGSKVFAGVVVDTKTIAGSTDTNVVIYKRGPLGIKKAGLTLDATYDDATKKGVVYAAMEAAGIQLLEAAA